MDADILCTLLAQIKKWNGITVYPDTEDENQKQIYQACQQLESDGKVKSHYKDEKSIFYVLC